MLQSVGSFRNFLLAMGLLIVTCKVLYIRTRKLWMDWQFILRRKVIDFSIGSVLLTLLITKIRTKIGWKMTRELCWCNGISLMVLKHLFIISDTQNYMYINQRGVHCLSNCLLSLCSSQQSHSKIIHLKPYCIVFQ